MKRIILLVLILIALPIGRMMAQKNNFELVWSDDFNNNGLPDSTKWSYDVGGNGWGNNELQYYTLRRLENARVEDGKLVIEARKEDFNGKKYTSARLVTKGKGDWLYGRFEIRAKLPRGKGTWPAGWMLSSDWAYGGWPESGEIDIMEHVGYDMGVNHVSCHSLEYYWKKNTQKTAVIKLNAIDSTYYTYAIEWTPDRIDAFVDDSLYFTYKKEQGWKKWPFDKPFHLILNIAIGGAWGGVQGIDDSIFPQKLMVDFVKVYKYKAPKDIIPPSSPENLTGTVTENSIALKWEPATDNYGVKEYRIECNGKEIGKSVRHSYKIDKPEADKTYAIKVIAVDWSGNVSKPVEGSYSLKK